MGVGGERNTSEIKQNNHSLVSGSILWLRVQMIVTKYCWPEMMEQVPVDETAFTRLFPQKLYPLLETLSSTWGWRADVQRGFHVLALSEAYHIFNFNVIFALETLVIRVINFLLEVDM